MLFLCDFIVMASDNLNFTNITNNRPGYAIPITFIGIVILIPIVTAFINKFKELRSVDVNFTSKLLLLISILLVIVLSIIALFVEFSNCIKYDIQMKIGERLINLCGGSQYYQRESPDELIASMIYKKGTDPINIEGSPIRSNIIINIILNIIYLALFLIYSFIILNRTILLTFESDPSVIGKNPILSIYKRFQSTKSTKMKITGGISIFLLLAYINLFIIASINEYKKIGKIPKEGVKKLKGMNLIKYSVLKVGFIGFAGVLLFVATKAAFGQSNVAGSEFMQDWNNSNILKILFGFMLAMALLTFSYKDSYEKLPAIVNEYMSKCESLNSELVKLVTTAPVANRMKNLFYKNILDLEPNVSDPVDVAITNRLSTLYQYVKHNNGKELLQLENGISATDLQTIRSKMKELRNYKNLKDTFKSYNKKIFTLFAFFVIIVFYIIFNYNYKVNNAQVTLLTVISIVILIIVTTIFGWFSNAILMN